MTFYPANTVATALTSGVTSGATDLTVDDGSTYPDPAAPGYGPYKILVGFETSREEVCWVTAKPSANVLRVTRAYDSSSASAKNAGDVVVVGVSSGDFTALNAKLPIAGGTMTGALILDADPSVDLGAATKQYVDDAQAAAETYADGRVVDSTSGSETNKAPSVAAVKAYAPTKSGTGATGTWAIGVSGNAATATKLATARTLAVSGDATGSASFDGSAGATIAVTVSDASFAPNSGYDPLVGQGSSDISKTVTNSKVLKLGSLVIWQFTANITGTGTAGQVVTVTPPYAPDIGSGQAAGAGRWVLAGTGYQVTVFTYSSGRLAFRRNDVTTSTYFGTDPSAGMVSGDSVTFTAVYYTSE